MSSGFLVPPTNIESVLMIVGEADTCEIVGGIPVLSMTESTDFSQPDAANKAAARAITEVAGAKKLKARMEQTRQGDAEVCFLSGRFW